MNKIRKSRKPNYLHSTFMNKHQGKIAFYFAFCFALSTIVLKCHLTLIPVLISIDCTSNNWTVFSLLTTFHDFTCLCLTLPIPIIYTSSWNRHFHRSLRSLQSTIIIRVDPLLRKSGLQMHLFRIVILWHILHIFKFTDNRNP